MESPSAYPTAYQYPSYSGSGQRSMNPRFVLVIALIIAFIVVGLVIGLVKLGGGGFGGLTGQAVFRGGEGFNFTLKAEAKEVWTEETTEKVEIIKNDGEKGLKLPADSRVFYYTSDGEKWIQRGVFSGIAGDNVRITFKYVDESGFATVSKDSVEVFNEFAKIIQGVRAEYKTTKTGEVALVATKEGSGKAGKEEQDLGEYAIALQTQKNGTIQDLKYTITADNPRVEVRYENSHVYTKIKAEAEGNQTK